MKKAKRFMPKNHNDTECPKSMAAEDSVADDQKTPKESQSQKTPVDAEGYPHYAVQSSIYSLLQSALALSERLETHPGAEARQRELSRVVKSYLDTCETIMDLHPGTGD